MKRTLGAVLCFSLAASFALAKDKPKKVDLAKLKPSIAEGWSGEFNTALQSWTFEKYTPGADDMNVPNRFYLGVAVTHASGQYPAPIDQSGCAGAGASRTSSMGASTSAASPPGPLCT